MMVFVLMLVLIMNGKGDCSDGGDDWLLMMVLFALFVHLMLCQSNFETSFLTC